MRRFRNILVGIDLSQTPRLSPLELGADNQEGVQRAIWLARHNDARLLFFSALYLSEQAQRLLGEEDSSRLSRTVEEAAGEAVEGLAGDARSQGVAAEARTVHGKGWVEIIRQVMRGGHDLVVVGARHVRGIRRLLFGSTSANLVRQCPCPVWVAKAAPVSEPFRVLIASDFSPAADEAVRLGLILKETVGARVDVLHAVEYPLDHLWSSGLPDPSTQAYHEKVRSSAREALEEQLRRAAGEGPWTCSGRPEDVPGVGLHLADLDALPDLAILRFVQDHHINLLIIGTLARSGLPGLVIGNTAERLLGEVSCSVLAVKPPDFHCPLRGDPGSG